MTRITTQEDIYVAVVGLNETKRPVLKLITFLDNQAVGWKKWDERI
jgi:hypothetical protein